MSWTLAAAWIVMSSVAAARPDPSLLAVPAQGDVLAAQWQLAMRVAGPVTTTDPNHIGVAIGVGRAGTYRLGMRYQPAESDLLGFMQGTVGFRVMESGRWTVAADVEHTHVWASRGLYRSGDFQFEGHDRRWLTLGVVSAMASDRRWLGVISGVEVGAGQLGVRDQVVGRIGSTALNSAPVAVLKTAAVVGMVGVRMSYPLRWGFDSEARVRILGAGHSRGGVVPFSHATAEWEISRAVFTSSRYGRGRLGLTGSHATSTRAATYYQNGVGLTFKIAF